MTDDRLHNSKALKRYRQELRKRATPAEAKLWTFLQKSRLEGRKFRRQHSIGSYIVDFYCPREKLAIELDGEPHFDPFRNDYDAARHTFLQEQGIRVLRIENREVFDQPEIVLQKIVWHFGR